MVRNLAFTNPEPTASSAPNFRPGHLCLTLRTVLQPWQSMHRQKLHDRGVVIARGYVQACPHVC